MIIHRLSAPLAAIALCLIVGQAAAQTELVVGYTGANAFMPAFVAKEQGYFEKRGLNVDLQLVPVGSTIPGALIADSLHVGGLTPPVLLQANEGGLALQIVAAATLQTRAMPTNGVIVRPDSGIKIAADFKGKKVGVPGFNGVNHVIFQKWLQMNGVDIKAPVFVEAPFPQMADMLKGGQIDAALPVEPFLKRAQDTGAGVLVARYTADVADSYLESFWVMTKKFVDANPQAVKAYREALKEGLDFIRTNPEEAKKTQVKYLRLPEPVVATLPLPAFALEATVAHMQWWVDLLKPLGTIRGTVKAADVVAK